MAERVARTITHLRGARGAAATHDHEQPRRPSLLLRNEGCRGASSQRVRNVVITGAGSGIGRASTLLFAKNGWNVLCADWNEDSVNETARLASAQPSASSSSVLAMKVDVRSEDQVKKMVDTCVERWGTIDAMFANAGVSGQQRAILDINETHWRDILDVNVVGVFMCAKHAARHMVKQSKADNAGIANVQEQMLGKGNGSIICTSSVAGLRSGAGGIVYSASKAAVIAQVQTIAQQLGGTGVRINAICPGIIQTGMTKPTFDFAAQRGSVKRIGQLNPLKRYGGPEEIASVAYFLATDAASYVNGQAIPIDGGLSSSHPVSGNQSAFTKIKY